VTTIAEVRQNLADIAETIDGWVGSKYVGDSVDTRTIKVFRPEFDPRVVFGGSKMQLTFRCVAYTKRIDSSASEEAIDALAELSGAGSFIVAVQDSTNWNVTVDYAVVTLVGEVGVTVAGDGVEYLACPFDVEVVW
jgi:hypothetical protein